MAEQLILLEKIHTKNNPADMMIKVVTREKLEFCAGLAGIDSN